MALNIKSRLLITYSAFVFVAVSVALFSYYYFVLPGYALLEQQDARHHLERVMSSIDREVVNLDRMVRDYAFWDDSYAFVKHRNQDYLQSNFLDEMMVDNRLNGTAIFDERGTLIFHKQLDLTTGVERPLDDSMYNEALAELGGGLIRPASGLLASRHGLQMVAARSIMTSDARGPVRGTMVFTRPLDSSLVNELSRQFRFDIQVTPLEQVSDDIHDRLKTITRTTPIVIHASGNTSLDAYAKLRDLNQNEIAMVQLKLPRTLYIHTRNIMISALGFALVSILTLALVFGAAVRRMVLQPFKEFSNVIHNFRKNDLAALPVTLSYEGEMGGLVQEFNYLLTDLEESRVHQTFSEEKTDLIKRVVPSAIFTVDSNKVITSWNARAELITGYSTAEMVGSTCFLFAQTPCQESCGLFDEGVDKPIMGRECTIRHKNGSILTISKNADFLRDAKGRIVGGIECFEDITTRKRSEEALQWELALNSRLAKLSHSILHNAGNVREVASELLEYARNLTGSSHGFVAELDEEDQFQRLWDHTPMFNGLQRHQGYPIIPAPANGRGSLLHSVYNRQSGVYFNSLEQLSVVSLADGISEEISHFMAVPVCDRTRIIGQVALANNDHGYGKRELQAIEQLAELFAVILSQHHIERHNVDNCSYAVKSLEVCQM
ncbi:MAG: hypothetical protein C0620_05395 [Desulfuromonas sp.]|nr:MAG: hypothetical protein C0620_05395 [Desulfuromonas sp.]